jgi:hypothetical protein
MQITLNCKIKINSPTASKISQFFSPEEPVESDNAIVHKNFIEWDSVKNNGMLCSPNIFPAKITNEIVEDNGLKKYLMRRSGSSSDYIQGAWKKTEDLFSARINGSSNNPIRPEVLQNYASHYGTSFNLSDILSVADSGQVEYSGSIGEIRLQNYPVNKDYLFVMIRNEETGQSHIISPSPTSDFYRGIIRFENISAYSSLSRFYALYYCHPFFIMERSQREWTMGYRGTISGDFKILDENYASIIESPEVLIDYNQIADSNIMPFAPGVASISYCKKHMNIQSGRKYNLDGKDVSSSPIFNDSLISKALSLSSLLSEVSVSHILSVATGDSEIVIQLEEDKDFALIHKNPTTGRISFISYYADALLSIPLVEQPILPLDNIKMINDGDLIRRPSDESTYHKINVQISNDQEEVILPYHVRASEVIILDELGNVIPQDFNDASIDRMTESAVDTIVIKTDNKNVLLSVVFRPIISPIIDRPSFNNGKYFYRVKTYEVRDHLLYGSTVGLVDWRNYFIISNFSDIMNIHFLSGNVSRRMETINIVNSVGHSYFKHISPELKKYFIFGDL